MSSNTVEHYFRLSKLDRQRLKEHGSFLIWFTGLSGSGKSTLSEAVERELFDMKIHTYPLDGDNIRNGINKGLGFSEVDREENIRRVAEIANLFVNSGTVVLGSFISPYQKNRDEIRSIVGKDHFIEVYLSTSVEECERRDVKGLYKRARSGEIPLFTGVSAPYEAPDSPDLEINTEYVTVEEAVAKVLELIKPKLKQE
ncbi:MAG: adenylyl-sulfate kinase [Crocinitomicaceae bacterium]|nr:adenylyl-sulfate kinase [Crocinitomicaceae bacterium]